MTRPAVRRALLAALTLALAAPATACTTTPEAAAVPAAEVPLARSASAAGQRLPWDWYRGGRESGARADQAQVVLAVDRQRLGRASWICSPAGSGMLSSCFER